jgi:chromosome segregation ATPase
LQRSKTNSGGLGVGMESAIYNSESATGLINCPKCGYSQENRLDCIKCGIVFSKYYALFPSSKIGDAIPAEQQDGQEMSELDFRTILSELQTQVRVLSTRFAEVEFEKAERSQIRQDLKNLERQLFEGLERLSSRIETPSIPQAQNESLDPYLPEIQEKLDKMESRLESLDSAEQHIVALRRQTEANSRQILDFQEKIQALREDFDKFREDLEAVSQAQKIEEPRTPLEEDVHIIRKNLDEFRLLLSK